jgi:photosystem II stability/assembly factor-like uncharacterized protein
MPVEAEADSAEVEGSVASFQFAMRAYPLADIDPALGAAARRTVARAIRRQRAATRATAARWTSLGPAGISGELTGLPPSNGGVVSGRVTALAVVPGCRRARCIVYLGAAGGGLWKTSNGLAARPVWKSLWDAMPTQAVGSIAVDPSNPRVVYVGSGEPNGSNDSEAGLGLFVSRDAGGTWRRLAAAPFDGLAIASLAIDPRRPRVLYAGAAYARRGASGVWGGRVFPPGTRRAGVYRSTDGGRTWRLRLVRPATDKFRFGGGVTRIRLDPVRSRIVYAAVLGHGLYRSSDGGGSWTRILRAQVGADGSPQRIEFDIARSRPNWLYAYRGSDGAADAGGLWLTTSARGRARFVKRTSTDRRRAASDAAGLCSEQCTYDLVVRVDPKRSKVVYVGGSAAYDDVFGSPTTQSFESNGRIVVRSQDGGRSFTDMTIDRGFEGLHPDMHALEFADDTRTWFAGNDGGIWRIAPGFVDDSANCRSSDPNRGRQLTGTAAQRCERRLKRIPLDIVSLNGGLDTLQYQGLGLDRSAPALSTIIGGTQDNGSHVYTGGRWEARIDGDGGQAAIGTGDPTLLWHTYFGAALDVSLDGGTTRSWTYVGQALDASGENASFFMPLQSDRADRKTAYVGLERVWRTSEAGGATGVTAADTNRYCNEFTTDAQPPGFVCGDWKPLGVTKLTGPEFGADKRVLGDDFVAWIHQSPENLDTAYVATRAGRLFRTDNLRAPDPAIVTFARIDTPALPGRFVSGIVNAVGAPNLAYVSFSGYGAHTPGQPGHVFAVNAATSPADVTDISTGLPDAPVTALAVDRDSGDLYAGTDFGVWRRPAAGGAWALAAVGLPRTAVFWLEYHVGSKTIVAGTHGRGVYTLKLH